MPQILLLGELFIKSTLICAEKFSGYGSMSDCTDLGKVSVGLWEKTAHGCLDVCIQCVTDCFRRAPWNEKCLGLMFIHL